ncbi:hypothetical protein GDO81_003517 [Engystomops pustulosus]|uniref:Secreted protein n=1 Tax=Engystomops pustulosus TaxID=76066 RepID=A0AAV6ZXI1_ENGPU|nr:hypothetical protein GDO81_003517 [Engystomops pustulosus]
MTRSRDNQHARSLAAIRLLMWLAALETPPPDEGCEPAETRVGLLSSRQRSGLIWKSHQYQGCSSWHHITYNKKF